jgi:hypothetical protein
MATVFPTTRRSWLRLRQNWHLWRASIHLNRFMDALEAAQDAGVPVSIDAWQSLHLLGKAMPNA